MAAKINLTVIARPLADFITPAMMTAARAQATKLVKSGMTIDQAAAESAAWVDVKAKSARIAAAMA